jgi:hypothetical protein
MRRRDPVNRRRPAGNVYNEAITEPATADDAPNATSTLGAALSEPASGREAPCDTWAGASREDSAGATIIYHGNREYSIGQHGPVGLTESEHFVLQAYLSGHPPGSPPPKAMDKPALCARSGVGHAPRVLRKLCGKYEGRFAPAIGLPPGKKKASGGYAVRIRHAKKPVTQRHQSHT